jgi:hypothetical protein
MIVEMSCYWCLELEYTVDTSAKLGPGVQMKRFLLAGAFMFWPVFALAQSTLVFPHSFTEQDRQSTGFAIVNPGATAAAVTFALYGADGSTTATANRIIPPRGQLAQLGSDLFPAATASGWVEVASAASGLQGLWLSGDFVNLNRGDGAVAASLVTDQVFPWVPVLAELSIANPNTFPIAVTIKGFNEAGAEIGTHTRMLAAKGITRLDAWSIVQTGILSYMRVRGTAQFASAVVLKATSSLDNAVQNGIDVSSVPADATTLIFPHFVDGLPGTLDYESMLAVVNLSDSRALNLRFQFFPESGGAPVESEHLLSPLSVLRGIAADFFAYREFGFQNGYVRVEADGPIAGVVVYGFSGDGGETIAPAQWNPLTSLLFAHIADLPPWDTGIALQNPSDADAIVEVFAIDQTGTLIGGGANVPTARFTLPAGGKTAKLLSELIPQTQTRTDDGGYVFVRTANSLPVHALQLIFTRNLQILTTIPGGGLPPGMIYVPPNP